MAMLTALSVVFALVIRVMIFAPLEYDAGDIPTLIGSFLFGPVAGLIINAVTCIIQGLTVSSGSGPWGIFMHFVATGVFLVAASLIYNRRKTLKNAVIGLIVGGILATAVMLPLNVLIMPLTGVPVDVVKGMLIPVVLPFNAIKVVINGAVTFLVYKPISKLVKGEVFGKKKAE